MGTVPAVSPPDSPPAWWQRGAIYQVYPRSFADADGDGVGDLRGVIARLDHLNDGTERSLGVEAIWLSPFSSPPWPTTATTSPTTPTSTRCSGRWRTSTSSSRRPTSAASASSSTSCRTTPPTATRGSSSPAPAATDPRRDWYVWRDGDERGGDGEPPNDWVSNFAAVGRAWTWDDATRQWYLHSFLPEQPDLNWDDARGRGRAARGDALLAGARRRRVPPRRHPRDRQGPRAAVGTRARTGPTTRTGSRPSTSACGACARWWTSGAATRRLVGEVYLFDLARVVAYVNSGRELHLAHNFTFVHLPWDAAAFRANIDGWEAAAGDVAWPAWFLSNHDHPRVASRFDDERPRARRARGRCCCCSTRCGGRRSSSRARSSGSRRDDPARARRRRRRARPRARARPVGAALPGRPGAGFTTGDAVAAAARGRRALRGRRAARRPAPRRSRSRAGWPGCAGATPSCRRAPSARSTRATTCWPGCARATAAAGWRR